MTSCSGQSFRLVIKNPSGGIDRGRTLGERSRIGGLQLRTHP